MTANERLAGLAAVFNDTCKKVYSPDGDHRLDVKHSLSNPEVMMIAGRLIIEYAYARSILPEITSDGVRYVVGMGSGGAVIEHSVASASLGYQDHGVFHWKHYNNPDVYGPNYIASYGAQTAVGEVLMVDDVVRSGGTLTSLHEIMADDLLVAKAAIVLVSHGEGQAEIPEDMPLHTLLTYDSQTERFLPNQF